MTARIIGIGAYAPETIVTNEDLSKIVETSDEWIRSRTGIRERRISTQEGTSDLAAKAARKALANAGVRPEELDIIILGTSSPDCNYPSDACTVQAAIGAVNAVAFDISAACAGFIFALNIVQGFFAAGIYKTALIIGAETLSKVTDWSDRGTCVLGDGRDRYDHGFRRNEGRRIGLYFQNAGKFPYGNEARAGLYDHGRPGGIQLRGAEDPGKRGVSSGKNRDQPGGDQILCSSPGQRADRRGGSQEAERAHVQISDDHRKVWKYVHGFDSAPVRRYGAAGYAETGRQDPLIRLWSRNDLGRCFDGVDPGSIGNSKNKKIEMKRRTQTC